MSCLERSLVLVRLMRHQGILPELQIGVRLGDDNSLSAHAWVEFEGIPINDRTDIGDSFKIIPLQDALTAAAWN